MSFSKALHQGQALASCHLCENETKINWKCLDCDVLMCDKCKNKIHVKLKCAKDHKVIAIKEVGLHRKELDFSNLKCTEHDRQSCVMFCTTCDKSVCTSCISKIHKGHGFIEITEAYEIKIEKFKNEQEKAKEKVQGLMKRQQELAHVNMKSDPIHKEVIKKIEAQNRDLKLAVEKYTVELKDDLGIKWVDLHKQEVSEVEKNIHKLKQLSSNAEDIIQSKDVSQLFFECEKLSSAVNLTETGVVNISFLPSHISPYIVGSLQVVSNDVGIMIVKQFRTNMSSIIALSLCPDNSIVISDQIVLQKVKPEGQKLTIESTLNIEVFALAVLPGGDIILSSKGLKQINGKTGELMNTIFNVEPFDYCTAVHVTIDGKILVAAKSTGSSFLPSTRSVIIMMNQTGEHETIYEHDKHNNRLFTRIEGITTTDNGNMCVVDSLSENCIGRVVILSQKGNILHVYTGDEFINIENKKFKPVNIVTTPSDNLIVKVENSDILHILNSYGHHITQFDVSQIGISMPYSFCFTRTAGHLYIGCKTGGVKSKKGIVYEVHISGC